MYLRTINTAGKIVTHLICSKSRVAPIKVITLPRLELCEAVLLSELASKVIEGSNMNITKVILILG